MRLPPPPEGRGFQRKILMKHLNDNKKSISTLLEKSDGKIIEIPTKNIHNTICFTSQKFISKEETTWIFFFEFPFIPIRQPGLSRIQIVISEMNEVNEIQLESYKNGIEFVNWIEAQYCKKICELPNWFIFDVKEIKDPHDKNIFMCNFLIKLKTHHHAPDALIKKLRQALGINHINLDNLQSADLLWESEKKLTVNGFFKVAEKELENNQIIPKSLNQLAYQYYKIF